MSKLKVDELDSRSASTITVTTTKTLSVPAGATLDVAGTANLTSSTLTLPATLPATALTNATAVPAAQLSGQVPLANLDNAPATDLNPIEDDIAVLGFQVAAASDLAQYNLRDQIVNTFQDATGIDASASTGEERNSTGKYWSGTSTVTPSSTGGTPTTYGDYTIHTFLSGTSNYVTDTTQDHDVLVVAGGGGSGSGGGGAGGMIASAGFSVTAATYAVTVGVGGAAGAFADVGGSGTNSIFSTLTAIGGGAGAGNDAGYGQPDGPLLGGSGGGVGATSAASLTAAPGTAGQGNAGGVNSAATAPGYAASGGGGAGAVGVNGSGTTNGSGGVGLQNDYRTGSNVYYAGGGAGFYTASSGSSGGLGGGGSAGPSGGSGSVNTGGGGGGYGAVGGSGIVVLRRTTTTDGPPGNMTLVSTATTAEAGTTATGDFVILYTPVTGSTVLNTNLKAYVSRNNGTTYTQATLTGKGSYSGTTEIASAHDIDISGQPAGVTMRWKIETLVQSAALETRVNGVSLGWS